MRPRSTPHPRPAPPHAQHVNLNRSFSSEGGAATPQVRSYLGHPSAPSRQESRGRSGSRRRRTRAREPGARIARAMQSEPPDATRSDAGGWAALIGRRPGSPQGHAGGPSRLTMPLEADSAGCTVTGPGRRHRRRRRRRRRRKRPRGGAGFRGPRRRAAHCGPNNGTGTVAGTCGAHTAGGRALPPQDR